MKKIKKLGNKMKQERFLIARGNTTLLIENCPEGKRVELSQKAIDDEFAEQVGFISPTGSSPELQMMGGELCVNGAIAFASTLRNSGVLKANRIGGTVNYQNTSQGLTEITFDLPYKRDGDIVLFEGIGYLCVRNKSGFLVQNTLLELSRKYEVPAFGLAEYNNGYEPTLLPIVYVGEINSCVIETACGSGSIALNIVTGANRIRQRTGEIISVFRYNNRFTVAAEVVKLEDKRL